MAYEMVDFRKDVIDACRTKPVVIDFWAPWCGPCRVLSPVIEKLANEARGAWNLVKINTDEHPEIAQQFAIQGIPAVKMVFEGKLVAEFTGALPETKIREWLKQHLPALPVEEEEDPEGISIESLIADGRREHALQFAAQLVKKDASSKENRAKLAMLYLPANAADAAKLIADAEESKFEIEREAVKTVLHLQSMLKEGFPDASNNAVKALFTDATAALFDERFEAALDLYIQVMMRDRSFDEDGARKACVAIFAMLTEVHPVAKNWRRRFSMALY